MRDYLDIGETTPWGENCVQVDPNKDYMPAMRAEANRFKDMLNKRFAKLIEATGIYFRIASNPHDFGSYLSLRICFDDNDEKQINAAYFIEENMPATWDDDYVFDWPVKKALRKEEQL